MAATNRDMIFVNSFAQYEELWSWIERHAREYLSKFKVKREDAEEYISVHQKELAQSEVNQYRNAWEEIAMDEQGPTMEHAVAYLMDRYGWSKSIAEKTAQQMYENTLLTTFMLMDKQYLSVFCAGDDKKLVKKLTWGCPIDFVRDWLRYQRGIKTTCIHKLFFKK